MRYRINTSTDTSPHALTTTRTVTVETWWGRDPLGPWPYYEGSTTTSYPPTDFWEDYVEHKSDRECYDHVGRRRTGVKTGLVNHPCVMRVNSPRSAAQEQEKTERTEVEVITHVGGYPYNFKRRLTVTELVYTWTPKALPGMVPLVGPDAVIVQPTVFADLKRMHARKCATAYRAGTVDLGAFLAELRECKSMFDIIRRRHWNTFVNIRNGIFTWEFGWKPFLSDLNKLLDKLFKEGVRIRANGVDTVQGAMPYFKKKQRVKSTHAPTLRPWLEPGTVLTSETDVDCEYTDVCTAQVVWETAQLWAISDVEYRYPALTRMQEVMLDSACAFGLTNPMKTLWEITPKSFVIDWFLGVGDLLERFDIFQSMYPPRIRNTTYHARTRHGVATLNSLYHGSAIVMSKDGTSFLTGKRYRRWVGQSPLDEEFFQELPDLRELVLTGLLIDYWVSKNEGLMSRLIGMCRHLHWRYGKLMRRL